jgi:hypothetical protein
MSTEVKCPGCGYTFPIEEVMTEEYKRELRDKMNDFKKEKEEELRVKLEENTKQLGQKQAEFDKKLSEQKILLQQEITDATRKNILAEFENKITMLELEKSASDEKLKLGREKELEFLKKERELKTKEEELDILLQHKLQEERASLTEQVKKQELEKNQIKETEHQLRVKELEKQLEDQKKLADEMRRKAEQGSMQLQGEAQELILEEMLRNAFPFDIIGEVGKGVRGADCIQTIRNKFGQECGKIIYESKRTTNFSMEWIEKLKKDMRSAGVDVAVIVTQSYPKGMDCFGEKDGVWICSYDEARAVAYVLRESIIKLYNASRSQENRGDKIHLLYDYLTGSEFSEQWKAIREGFMSMRLSIQKERDAMERLWKSREKQLEKVLINAAQIRGSVEGIAGSDTIHLSLTDELDDDSLLLE